jgi:AraC family transcriptional regulator, transcriptional activator of the genes for pyochelin and ferripyochelin receptors
MIHSINDGRGRMSKVRVEVSSEMLSYVGQGSVVVDWPANWIVFAFHGFGTAGPVCVGASAENADDLASASLLLAIDPDACRRLVGQTPALACKWHLPSDLRAVALAITDCDLPEPLRATLRLAKSIELVLALLTREAEGALVAADDAGELREGDAVRLLHARRLIADRWDEKLTLDAIARACGLNRAKLTRGFRLMFNSSVADALAENRLAGARRMVRETDMQIASIGYACGYNNTASFTRAFTRRFGMPPTSLRQAAA